MMACVILIAPNVQLVINIGLAAWACPPIVRVPLVSTAIVPTVKYIQHNKINEGIYRNPNLVWMYESFKKNTI